MQSRYFEDFKVGERFKTLSKTVTEEEILTFSNVYDSQPFHLDVESAKKSIYGGMIASGFLTASIAWNLFVELRLIETTSMGALGLNHLKWKVPVRPGDTLSVETEVVDKKDTSKPDRGVLTLRHIARNQRGEDVLEYESLNIIAKRSGAQ